MIQTFFEFIKEARRASMDQCGLYLSSMEAMALAQRGERLEIENEGLKHDLATCASTIDRIQAKALREPFIARQPSASRPRG